MSQGMGQLGLTVQAQSVQSRELVINGEIIGIATERKKLLVDTILPQDKGKLIINGSFFLNVVPRLTPIISNHVINCFFQLNLVACYPYWQKLNEDTIIVAGDNPLFRFPWNMQKKYKFSERLTEVAANVFNDSNIPIHFKVIFEAETSVTNPKIVKVSTREFIRITKVMEAGDIIEVDMTGGITTVISKSEGLEIENIGYLDIDSTPFQLEVGNNVIRYEADKNVKGINIRIIVNETKAGVVI